MTDTVKALRHIKLQKVADCPTSGVCGLTPKVRGLTSDVRRLL
jgi:hypothetical protein